MAEAVEKYWSKAGTVTKKDLPRLEQRILGITNMLFDMHNDNAPKDERWNKLTGLDPLQISMIILRLYEVRWLDLCDGEFDADYGLLAIYMEEGTNAGTYQASEIQIQKIILDISPAISVHNIKEVTTRLQANAKTTVRTINADLIPVNNGIFDYKNKKLLPFSPDYVYLSKCPVDYIPGAQNPVIQEPGGKTWDVETWMQSLSDDKDIVTLLWEILGAIIRPGVKWDKAAWLYSNTGNNGKGTLCELMRALCGPKNHTSISLEEFARSNDFILESLVYASAIIVDENNVGAYIDKSKDLKAVITGDVIQINRKYKTSLAYKFHGFMVQCLNDYPKIKDRSDSFARRQLIIPMTKCFTGKENKAIKSDYLHRPEVLQYILCKILHSNYYTLSEPVSCRLLLDDYRESNDILRTFASDVMDQLVWDIVPFQFLYELYTAWSKRMNPSGQLLSIATFKDEMLNLIKSVDYGWYCNDKMKVVWVSKKDRTTPEPLIAEYNLVNWMNPSAKNSNDVNKLCIPPDSKFNVVRGIRRKPGWKPVVMAPEAGEEEECSS